jgi:hypothetical protein
MSSATAPGRARSGLEDALELVEVVVQAALDGRARERAQQVRGAFQLDYCVELNDRLVIRTGMRSGS